MSQDASQVVMIKHQTGHKKPLNEVKMLLVGERGVGKTSLVKLLCEGTFDRDEQKTERIKIERLSVMVNSEKIWLNIWDFGKEELKHDTYKFFLTERSIYLLVLNARLGEKENRVEQWLRIIKSFGGDSPVIIVGNKIDKQPLDLDRQGLKKKYANIRDFVEISYEMDADGLDKLRTVIEREVDSLEHVHDPLLTTWSAVKNRLEGMEEDHIPYQKYLNLCKTEGITDDLSQRNLIRLLHDLGIVLNFQDDPRLEEINILNPEWVINGVHGILNSPELSRNRGVLERNMLNQILDSRKYPTDKHHVIMAVMRKFELCFDLDGGFDQKFLIPYFLSNDGLYIGNWCSALAFQYHYDEFPKDIISRFIARTFHRICKNTYWRGGVLLKYDDDGNEAVVTADRENKKIVIWVRGKEQNRRIFLNIICSDFDRIHNIMGIKPTEKVPLPDDLESAVGYEHLLFLEDSGENYYYAKSANKKRYKVKELLDGVEPEEERMKRREESGRRDPTPPMPPPQPITPAVTPANPWISGSFYLMATVVIMTVIAVIIKYVLWYAIPVVIIGGIAIIAVIGALQLRQDNRLSEASFLALVRETFKQLPLLKTLLKK